MDHDFVPQISRDGDDERLRAYNFDEDNDDSFFVSQGDVKFMKRIVAENDHPVYVIHSHLVLGYYYLLDRTNFEKGMHHFQCCVRFYKEASEEEFAKDHKIDPSLSLSGGWKMFDVQNIGEYMKALAEIANVQLLNWFFASPGSHCEGCAKPLREGKQDVVGPMNVCSRCRRTYYCSRECQVNHWHADHKDKCRMRGEFVEDDHAILAETVPEFLPSGYEVLLEEYNESDDTWSVVGAICKRKAVVTEKQLRVMTPADRRLLDYYYQNNNSLCVCKRRIGGKKILSEE